MTCLGTGLPASSDSGALSKTQLDSESSGTWIPTLCSQRYLTYRGHLFSRFTLRHDAYLSLSTFYILLYSPGLFRVQEVLVLCFGTLVYNNTPCGIGPTGAEFG